MTSTRWTEGLPGASDDAVIGQFASPTPTHTSEPMMQTPTPTFTAQPTVEPPPIPTPSGQPHGPPLTSSSIGPAPEAWRTRRKIGQGYYQLAMIHQAGQLTEHERLTYGIKLGDRLEIQLFPEGGRAGELAALVIQEGGVVLSNDSTGLLVEISIPTLLVLEQSPALGGVTQPERVR